VTHYFDIRDLDCIRACRDRLRTELTTCRLRGDRLSYVVVDCQLLKSMVKLSDWHSDGVVGLGGKLDQLRGTAVIGKEAMGSKAELRFPTKKLRLIDFQVKLIEENE